VRSVSRVLIGAWLLWFTATLVENPGTRICPLHGSHAAAQHGHAGTPHTDHHAGHASSSRPAGHADACSCPDACRCGTPALLAPFGGPRLHDAVVVTRVVALDLAAAAPCLARAYALPFANGPPVL
jgi:hypothetical protein